MSLEVQEIGPSRLSCSYRNSRKTPLQVRRSYLDLGWGQPTRKNRPTTRPVCDLMSPGSIRSPHSSQNEGKRCQTEHRLCHHLASPTRRNRPTTPPVSEDEMHCCNPLPHSWWPSDTKR